MIGTFGSPRPGCSRYERTLLERRVTPGNEGDRPFASLRVSPLFPRVARVGIVLIVATLFRPIAFAQAPRPASGPPGSMRVPAEPDESAKFDPRVAPVQAPGSLFDDEARPAGGVADDVNPLGPSKERPGSAPSSSSGEGPSEGDHFALPVDRLSMGRQEVRLSIEIQQPGNVINLGREMTLNLVIKNVGNVEAVGVAVVYQVPDGLELISATPEPLQDPVHKTNYYWKKETLAVNGDWTIPVRVKATKVTACDTGATVTAKAGARARLVVQEPKLKVEQSVSTARLLIGRQTSFKISVSNPGTGPARNVIVQAKLSDGLRTVDGETIVEQMIPVIPPGVGRVDLNPLVVDTRGGGQQSCTVMVHSPDVTPVAEDNTATRMIEVISPKLEVKLAGHEQRFTDQKNDYTLTLSNPGTAPAENVKLVATMPTQGGRLINIGDNLGVWDQNVRKVYWDVGKLEPKDSREFHFTYLTGGPGLYSMMAEATSGEQRSSAQVATDVSGLAVIAVQMKPTNPIIDVNDTTTFDIQVRNLGSKEATKILINGTLTTNMVIVGISGLDKEVRFNVKDGRFTFPEIERLAPGQTLALTIEAKAVDQGSGMCRLLLDHADLPHGEKPSEDDLIHAVGHTTITGARRPRVSSTRP